MPNLTTTGLAGLDAQLGGGIPRGTTVLMLAEPGNSVPVFSEQFSGGGLDAGDTVFYFDLDRPSHSIRDHCLQYVADPDNKQGELRVYDGYSSQFGKGFLATKADAGNALPLPRNEALFRMIQEISQVGSHEPYRVVVESLSALVTEESKKPVLEFFKQFVYMNHELGGTALVSLVKGLHDPVFETQLKHLAGGVMEIGMERKGFGLYPYLMVTKMLDLPDPVRLLLFKETEKGLWLESTKRVF